MYMLCIALKDADSTLSRELLKGAFKIGWKVIRTAKYEDHIVLLAKKETAR